MKQLLIYFFIIVSTTVNAQVSIIGTATPSNNWTTDHNMTETSPGSGIWLLFITLTANEVKFRNNGNWTINWGGPTFPTGTGVLEGPNLLVTPPGQYNITFNTNTLAYDFMHINSPPIAVDDNASTNENIPLVLNTATLLSNDTDADGDPLTISSVSNPVNGSVILIGIQITFTPSLDFNGAATFEYTVSDGPAVDVGLVNVNVVNVNNAPIAVDDNASTNENIPLVLNTATLLSNDTDADGDPLTISSVSNPVNGAVILIGTQITFTPSLDFNGAATFQYTVSDGPAVDVGLVNVNVVNVNNAPIAVDDNASTNENIPLVLNTATLLSNDTDADGDPLTISSVSNPVNGAVILIGTQITFTPSLDFNGAATFEYTVSDGPAVDVGLVNVNVVQPLTSKIGINTTQPNSTLQINGSLGGHVVQTSNSYTLGEENFCLIYLGPDNNIVNLPNPINCSGRMYIIVNHGTASLNCTLYYIGNNITSTSILENTSLSLISDGAVWRKTN